MSQQDLLTLAVHALERAGIEYMVTGSIVSSLQGEPRSTHDLDFVVSLDVKHVEEIVQAFPPPSFYLDRSTVLEAIQSDGVFNVIDTREGDKIDFWMLTESPFDRSRFSRKYVESVFGVQMQVSRPEDTILAKLRWARMSGDSERLIQDAIGVFQVQQPDLDLEYLTDWANRLEVEDLFNRVLHEPF